jgi:predicted transcriptional regulator
VATKKITITLPEDTLARLRESAAASGIPLSTYIAQVTEHHARIEAGLAEMREWEAEHGEFTDEERASVAAEIAGAEGRAHSTRPEAKAS